MRTLLIMIVSLVLVAPLTLGQSDTLNCKSFHEGYFAYPMEGFESVLIKRTDTQQEEINLEKGTTLRFDIDWTSDCSYNLTLIWTDDEAFTGVVGSVLEARIIDSTPDTYDYTASLEGRLTRGMMIKISKKQARAMEKKFAPSHK